MANANLATGSFHITAAPTVRITVYDAAWSERGTGEGEVTLELPAGFYRVYFERGGATVKQVIEHEGTTSITDPANDPPVRSAVPIARDATTASHRAAAERLSDTWPLELRPSDVLGDGPFTAGLFVFVRRTDREGAPPLLGGQLSIHHADGRPIEAICHGTAVSQGDGYLAYARRATPGTYVLRAHPAHRQIAITIPAGRTAQVFLEDAGADANRRVALDDARIALVPRDTPFNADDELWLVMEVVLAALRGSGRPLPQRARALCALCPRATDDLCFGIAVIHVLARMRRRARDTELASRGQPEYTWSDDDEGLLQGMLARLADYHDLPDVAILERLYGATQPPIPDSAPLFLDSLRLLTDSDASRAIPPTGAITHAARALIRDSVWCTSGSRAWDERPPLAAIEAYRADDPKCDAAALARELVLPVRTVETHLQELAAQEISPLPALLENRNCYRLGAELGRGPRSIVYLAQRADGKEAAIKIVPLHGGDLECAWIRSALDRSERSGHRNVIAPEDWGELPDGAGIWLAMEHCKRRSLLDRLSESDRPLGERDARSRILDALAGLDYLHQREIAHGSIKPANLLERADGSVALVDPRLTTAWLLAKANAGAPARPRFAAPEQLLFGGQPQLLSDVWSIAATIYFLLTLELPRDEYVGQTQREAARDNPIIAIRERHPGVPDAIAVVLDRALSPDVHARPGDGESLRGNLLYQGGILERSAKLLHGFCFDEITLEPTKSIYEPRGSCRCDDGCGSVWVATKTGEVLRITPSPDRTARVTRFFGQQEARAICHQHDGGALHLPGTPPVGPVLLIGRDDGTLDIVSVDGAEWADDPERAEPGKAVSSFHLDAWWEQRGEGSVVRVSESLLRSTQLTEGEFTWGVTAIAALSPLPGDPPNTLTILVATRALWLYVIDADHGELRLRNRIEMPDWVSWLLPLPEVSTGDAACVVAVSRGGDIVTMTRRDLDAKLAPEETRLPMGVTAALAFDEGVLIGTGAGLLMVDATHKLGVPVPVTRSAVLCLDRAALVVNHKPREYVTIGTDDGHLRVLESAVIRAHVESRPVDPELHNFPIALGAAVLAVQIARPAGPGVAYVIAAVRDEPPRHAVRLFHVTNLEDVQHDAFEQWQLHVARWFAKDPAAPTLADQLAAARIAPLRHASAWKYLLIDVVLPRLRGDSPLAQVGHDDVVALACELACGGDSIVLHGLSNALGKLTRRAGETPCNRVDLLLALSRAIVAAIPPEAGWTIGVIEHHLRALHAITHAVHGADRARLVAWTRFVRKYVLLGPSFVKKDIQLIELVEQNCQTTKYLDALIYQARLVQRGYDLRWRSSVAGEIVRLHVVAPAGERSLVIAITTTGGVAVFDADSGDNVCRDAQGPKMFAPFAGEGRQVQVRASAATCDGSTIRIVLGCTGDDAPGCGMAVVELRRGETGAQEVTTETRIRCRTARTRVTALEPLPGHHDVFAVGLETIGQPIGLLRRTSEGWAVEPACEVPTAVQGESNDDAGLAVEQVSATRALAIVATDDRNTSFLLVAGSDDGIVRVVSFQADDAPSTWQIARWDRAADAITSIVLGRRNPTWSSAADDTLFYCYVGTTEGDVFALAILDRDAGAGTAVSSFGRYVAQPMWREVHDGPLLAMQMWNTCLYDPSDVLITVTEKGRLCVHNHVARRGDLSSSANYYFRGMRFDGVNLPRARAVTMIDGGAELVAAGPQGQLYCARLVYLRDSVDRDTSEQCPAEHSSDLSRPSGPLPTEMWARMHYLLAASQHDEYLHDGPVADVGDEVRYERKLELCSLIRLGGGAMAAYALRKRLLLRGPWETRAGDLRDDMRRELARLDPRTPAGVDQIKVVIRTMCRALLYDDLDQLRREIVDAERYAPGDAARTQAVCEVMSRYITRDLAALPPAEAALRTSALKELLRVPVLLHMAVNDDCARLVTAAIDSCLVDDSRIVRTEALRALSVVLRNVCIMLEARGYRDDRDRLIKALFPRGLGSLSWLLDRLIAGLQRFPSFTRRSPLVSGAWPQISVLNLVFRIFPDRTLALCDYLIRAGLDVEVLALCHRSLRWPQVATIRRRIEYLYLIAPLDHRDARAAFIARYTRNSAAYREMLQDMELEPKFEPIGDRHWYDIEDRVLAGRLLESLDVLVRMWGAQERPTTGAAASQAAPAAAAARTRTTTERLRALRQSATSLRPLAALEQVVDELRGIDEPSAATDPARSLDTLDHLAGVNELLASNDLALATATRPFRTVIRSIIAAWQPLLTETAAFPNREAQIGDEVAEYKLTGVINRGRESDVFAVADPRYVVKVLRNPSKGALDRFLESAELARRLSASPDGESNIVRITRIDRAPPRAAYVMERHSDNLEAYFEKFESRKAPVAWAVGVAEDIDRALTVVHRDPEAGHRRFHGRVTTTNILVHASGPDDDRPRFILGDFDRLAAPEPLLPTYLARKYRGERDDLRYQQWIDIAALALIVYRMLTGEEIKPSESENFGRHSINVASLADDLRAEPGAQKVVATLRELFERHKRPFAAGAFQPPIAASPSPV